MLEFEADKVDATLNTMGEGGLFVISALLLIVDKTANKILSG